MTDRPRYFSWIPPVILVVIFACERRWDMAVVWVWVFSLDCEIYKLKLAAWSAAATIAKGGVR